MFVKDKEKYVVPADVQDVVICGRRLSLDDIVFSAPERVKSLTIYAETLDARPTDYRLPGKELRICAYRHAKQSFFELSPSSDYHLSYWEMGNEESIYGQVLHISRGDERIAYPEGERNLDQWVGHPEDVRRQCQTRYELIESSAVDLRAARSSVRARTVTVETGHVDGKAKEWYGGHIPSYDYRLEQSLEARPLRGEEWLVDEGAGRLTVEEKKPFGRVEEIETLSGPLDTLRAHVQKNKKKYDLEDATPVDRHTWGDSAEALVEWGDAIEKATKVMRRYKIFQRPTELRREQGRWVVVVVSRLVVSDSLVWNKPDPTVLRRVADHLLSVVLSTQVTLAASTSDDEKRSARHYLDWLHRGVLRALAGAESKEVEARLRDVRSLIAGILQEPSLWRRRHYVPSFAMDIYQQRVAGLVAGLSAIEQQLKLSRSTRTLYEALRQINQNVAQGSTELSTFIQSVAAQEGDMAAHYGAIIAEKKRELEAAKTHMAEAGRKVDEQKKQVEARRKEYRQKLEEELESERRWAIFEGILAVAGAVALAAATYGSSTTLLVSATGALIGEISETASRGARLAATLEKLIQLAEYVAQYIKALSTIAPTDLKVDAPPVERAEGQDMGDALWNEAANEFEASLPDKGAIEEKNRLVAAFRNLVVWAQKQLGEGDKIIRLQAEILANESLKRVSEQQRDRLNEIRVDPRELATIDWDRMFYDIEVTEKKLQARIADVFVQLDRAAQYQFHTPPTELNPDQLDLYTIRSRIDDVWKSLTDQGGGAGGYRPERLKKPVRIEFRDIEWSRLAGGKAIQLEVSPREHGKRHFPSYAMIRVRKMRVEISAKSDEKSKTNDLLVSTSSDQYLVEWKALGTKFFDIPPVGDPIELYTDPVSGTSRYLRSNHELYSEAAEDDLSRRAARLTPFTTWWVSLPVNTFQDVNGGLQVRLKKGRKTVPVTKLDVTLVFEVDAVPRPMMRRAAKGSGRATSAAKRTETAHARTKKVAAAKGPRAR